jgi:hemerythrin superfamily protein
MMIAGCVPIMSSQRTIFDVIRDDHETQRTLVSLLIETVGQSDGRTELWPRLKRELHAHAGAEERFFYVPLMEHDMTQDAARHSVAEHKELDDFIEQLDGYDMSAPQWLQTARELAERLIHHLDEEENEIYPVAGRVLSDAEKTSLGSEYLEDMERRRNG